MLNSAKRAPVSHLRRRALALGPAAALLAFPAFLFVQSGCGSDDEEPTGGCIPGAQQSCPAAGCNDGVQVCAPDGASFEPCICPDATGPGAGGSNMGAGGMGGMTMGGAGGGAMPGPVTAPGAPPPFTGATGSPCENDSDCFGGMTCLNQFPVEKEGQVAGGYCTLPCTSNEDCQAVDGSALCQGQPSSDGNSYCLALCAPGGGELVPGAPACGANRPDMACGTADPGDAALCVPTCIDDASCGGEQVCDLGSGLCVSPPREGLPLGAGCTEDAQCNTGGCAKTSADPAEVGFCTGLCRFGAISGCGFGPDVPDGERGAGCIVALAQGGGPGDLGLCAALCDEAADCEGEGFECAELPDAFVNAWARTGACLPGTDTANGGADAGAPGGAASADAGVAAN